MLCVAAFSNSRPMLQHARPLPGRQPDALALQYWLPRVLRRCSKLRQLGDAGGKPKRPCGISSDGIQSLINRRAPKRSRSKRYRSAVRNKGTVHSSRVAGSRVAMRLRRQQWHQQQLRRPPRAPTPTRLLPGSEWQLQLCRCLLPL
jgi:hypothetical protein